MKAARFYNQGDIRIDDIPEPELEDGQVLVEVEWGGNVVDAEIPR